MSSVVYYKFKNTKDDWKSISFEGPYISALEVKKQITLQQHFSDKHCDFHLLITNAENKDGMDCFLLILFLLQFHFYFYRVSS